MLSRGTFNGPGGPHSRWMIPPTGGALDGRAAHAAQQDQPRDGRRGERAAALARGAGRAPGWWSRGSLARAVQPDADELSGVNVAFDTGDQSPACDVNTDPFCDGGGYDNYTVEVVDRMGTDSFTPDAGVLLAKTKNSDATRRSSG